MRNFAILIPNFNGESFILETIQRLNVGFPDVKILVVDDCSTDNSVKVLKDHLICTMVRARNGGFAAAVNDGINELRANGFQFALVCNSDISPSIQQCSSVSNEFNSFQGDGSLGVIGFLEEHSAKNAMRYQPPNISGFLFWIKLSIIEKVGLFDERFYMYGEETDFFRRVLHSGISIKQSNIYVSHSSERSGKSRVMNSWLAIRNSIFLEVKHRNYFGALKKIILLELVIIGVKGDRKDPSVQRVRRPGIFLGTIMLAGAVAWNFFKLIFSPQ